MSYTIQDGIIRGRWTHEETVSSGGTSDPVYILPSSSGDHVSVTAIPGGGGTASVEFTTSSENRVQAGNATWQVWPTGSVSEISSEVLEGPVTALRFKAVTADATFEVVI